ncbi:MAG: MarR family transcriptional regulator [bacterium]|nr:MarR family transcriptional regulator [bacterium]
MKIEEEINQSKFNNSQTKVLINILYTASRINNSMVEVLKPFDLTQPQYNILRILRGRKGELCNCGDIKKVMIDKNPDVTRICDKLKDKDLITRQLNKNNRREVLLSINKNGLNILKKIDPQMDAAILEMAKINDKDLEMLSALLDSMRA